MKAEIPIERARAPAFTVLTDKPETDGTIEWNSALVMSEGPAGQDAELGYTCSAASAAELIRERFVHAAKGRDRLDPNQLAGRVFHEGCASINMKVGSDPYVCPRLRHLQWSHDHVRIERMLFEGASIARNGIIQPDLSRPRNASYSRKMTLSVV
jgi:hypothetical protein